MATATMDAAPTGALMSTTETMRDLASKARSSASVNVKDISHDESMLQPESAGNCINWVLGHLLAVYSKVLPMFGEQPVIARDRLARYDRYSAPMTDSAQAIPFSELVAAWNTTCDRVDAGLSRLPEQMLTQPVADSPTNNPKETVQSLLFTIMFHQAYHAGQLGVLRRLVGKEGAIK